MSEQAYRILIGPNGDHAGMHTAWIVEVDGRTFYVSHVRMAFDTLMPECMAFECDEDWEVDDWDDKAVSHLIDPQEAFADVMGQLVKIYKKDEG